MLIGHSKGVGPQPPFAKLVAFSTWRGKGGGRDGAERAKGGGFSLIPISFGVSISADLSL